MDHGRGGDIFLAAGGEPAFEGVAILLRLDHFAVDCAIRHGVTEAGSVGPVVLHEGNITVVGMLYGEGPRYGEVALGKGNGIFSRVLDRCRGKGRAGPAGGVGDKAHTVEGKAFTAERGSGFGGRRQIPAGLDQAGGSHDIRGCLIIAAAGECACPCKGAVVKDGQGAVVGHRAVHGQGLALGNGQAGVCGDRQIVDGAVGRQGDVAVDRAVHHAGGQGLGSADVRSGDPCVAVDGERTGVDGITAAANVCCAPAAVAGGNGAAVDGDIAAVAGGIVTAKLAAAADTCRAHAANGVDRAALNDDGAAAIQIMTANAGASHSFGSQSAATPDGQGASFIDLNAAALFAATEVVGALEDQGDICRISKESHGLIVVRRSIINGQIADPNRHGEVRFHLQALARGAGGNERAGDGDLLRGIKVRRGQSVAVADLDRACRVAVQDLDGALSDVKDIAVGVACRERAEGQHRQKHGQDQQVAAKSLEVLLHVCFLLC